METIEKFYRPQKGMNNVQRMDVSFGKNNKKPLPVKKIILVGLVVIFAGMVFLTGFFYYKYKKATIDQNQVSKQEIEKITKDIKKFANLPDEEPTIATVTDKEKLTNQPFFKNAENGDRVLIYSKAGKAILYRPSTKKVIEMTLLNGSSISSVTQTGSEATTDKTSGVQAQGVAKELKPGKVAIYNGTSKITTNQEIADKISAITGVQIGPKGSAKKKYDVTVVVDLTGENTELTQEIASQLKGVVRELPAGETKPEADVLVIGGGQ
jgi:hypothetical protein